MNTNLLILSNVKLIYVIFCIIKIYETFAQTNMQNLVNLKCISKQFNIALMQALNFPYFAKTVRFF